MLVLSLSLSCGIGEYIGRRLEKGHIGEGAVGLGLMVLGVRVLRM